MIVRCASCHREERWEGADRQVVLAGGARRPAVPAPLAAWQALRDARAGGASVVGACPTCAQPLVASSGAAGVASVPFVVSTPAGDLVVGPEIRGPAGVLDEAAADAFVAGQFPVSYLPTRQDALGAFFLAPMLFVVALWVVGALVALTFLTGQFGRAGLAYPILLTTVLAIGVAAWFSRRNER